MIKKYTDVRKHYQHWRHTFWSAAEEPRDATRNQPNWWCPDYSTQLVLYQAATDKDLPIVPEISNHMQTRWSEDV